MRIAIDTGGTFTDCVFLRDGTLRIVKVLSTPDNPARAIAEAVRAVLEDQTHHPQTGTAARPRREALELTCGTTVGTNALLERRGGRVALFTTEGFEDVLEIGRQVRPQLYDWFVKRTPPLAPRERRFGIRERISAEGYVLLSLTEREVERAVRLAKKADADAVAVSLLFSFLNARHERLLAKKLRAAGLAVSASHEILPQIREYERTATTVTNAYLLPVMSRYLREIGRLAGRDARRNSAPARSRVRVMQSNGGIISAEAAAREPVRTILSGPAGGVLGAQAVAEAAGFHRTIAFDMGGTSTDVSLIDGAPRTTSESEVAGLPVAVPVLDIHTVGAGGGSLARFDRGGALRVGPESAGANPGPICYGRGVQPAVTDAHLILGRIVPEGFLGGEFRLDLPRTREWMARACGPLKTPARFAQGILDVVEMNMEKAIRVISIERGHDPRDYTLVAFGGAGGLHACGLAAALEIPRVLVPNFPGGLSAFGILRADVVKDFSRTILLPVKTARESAPALRRRFLEMERQAIREMRKEGFAGPRIRTERMLDMRYAGQAYELTVPVSGDFVAAFHRAHEKRYGYSDARRPAEVVNIRVRAIGLTSKRPLPRISHGSSEANAAIIAEQRVLFSGRAFSTKVYDRTRLRAGNRFAGPAIVAEYSATTIVLPGWQSRVDSLGNLILERT